MYFRLDSYGHIVEPLHSIHHGITGMSSFQELSSIQEFGKEGFQNVHNCPHFRE